MSIRILPESEISESAGKHNPPPLLFANPKNLYHRRAKRLRALAKDNPFKDYLEFVANIVEVQLYLLDNYPIANISEDLTALLTAKPHQKPLDITKWQRSPEWQQLLLHFIEKFKPYANDHVLPALERLEKSSGPELEMLADHLLQGRYELVGADNAVFLWSALSLYWLQLAQQLPKYAKAEYGEHRHHCPVCGTAPVASVVHFGDTQGLRYLHCALCESEWNVVRAKCSNCEQTGEINYWALDSVEAAVKAESCGDCESYLKVMYQEKDPYVEPIADDIASLFLDVEMEQKNFFRSGLNPFLFQAD